MEVEKFKVGNLRVAIETDDHRDGTSRDCDNLGTMVCWHHNYKLGDDHEFKTPQDFEESDDRKNAAVILPLRLYDHSGITMSVGFGASPFDPGGWDSGQVGWIYVTRAKLRSEYSRKHVTKSLLAKAEEVLRGEVKTYDQDLTGDVYGYIIEDEHGNDVESCWGFYGIECVREEARSAAENAVKEEAEEVKKIEACMAL
jgi:hypothetical protein